MKLDETLLPWTDRTYNVLRVVSGILYCFLFLYFAVAGAPSWKQTRN